MPPRGQRGDERQRAGQLGRERQLRDEIAEIVEPAPILTRVGSPKKFRPMRPGPGRGKVGAFDVNSQQPRALPRGLRRPKLAGGHEQPAQRVVRRRDAGERERRRAAGRGVKPADRRKPVGVRLHGVAAQRAVNVPVNESRREEIARALHDAFARLRRWRRRR